MMSSSFSRSSSPKLLVGHLVLLSSLLIPFTSAEISVLGRRAEECKDDSTFTIAIGQNKNDGCAWLDRNPGDTIFRRNEQCNNINKGEEIRERCPRACGECCGDNPSYQFEVEGETVDCSWIRESQSRIDQYCNNAESLEVRPVYLTCPFSCGRCPTKTTSTPSKGPSASPTPAPTTKAPTPGIVSTLYYEAEIYTTTKYDVLKESKNTIIEAVNKFFRKDIAPNHMIHTDLAKAQLYNVYITSLEWNADVQGYTLSCGISIPANTVCNKAIGQIKLSSSEDYTEDEIISKTMEILSKHDDGVITYLPQGMEGVLIKSLAKDRASLLEASTDISPIITVEDGSKPASGNNAALIALPTVACALVVMLIIGAYIVHRRRSGKVIVELSDTADMDTFDEEHMIRRGTRSFNIVPTEELVFPVNSMEDDNYLPGLDCICGAPPTKNT